MKKLIYRYFSRSISKEETELLNEWVQQEGKQEKFKNLVELHCLSNTEITPPKSAKKEILRKIRKRQQQQLFWRYAASIALLIGIGQAFLWYQKSKDSISTVVDVSTEVVLEQSGKEAVVVSNEELNYQINKTAQEKSSKSTSIKQYKPIVNKLSVPNGKRFSLTLSDGTKVYLNSGSTLFFPEKFQDQEDRVVTLSGHANFNVVHNNSKFLVQTKDSIEVEVLGTNFNVMAYPEQEIVQTVLAEGKVSFGVQGKQKVTLKPMYKAEFKLGEIKVQEVDLFEYFAWLEGILVFKDRSFQEILRTLEKYYDVEIYCENQQLLRKKFDATFDVETIEHVLQSFQENFQFEYELNKKQILIK